MLHQNNMAKAYGYNSHEESFILTTPTSLTLTSHPYSTNIRMPTTIHLSQTLTMAPRLEHVRILISHSPNPRLLETQSYRYPPQKYHTLLPNSRIALHAKAMFIDFFTSTTTALLHQNKEMHQILNDNKEVFHEEWNTIHQIQMLIVALQDAK